jgi:hypothetical protein
MKNALLKNSLPHGLCLFQSSEYARVKQVNQSAKPILNAFKTFRRLDGKKENCDDNTMASASNAIANPAFLEAKNLFNELITILFSRL